jgi:hypothetical protein
MALLCDEYVTTLPAILLLVFGALRSASCMYLFITLHQMLLTQRCTTSIHIAGLGG